MKNQLLAKVAAVISTLNETNGSPESMLYIFFDMNLDLWNQVKSMMVQADLIECKNHFVTLTANGKVTAQRIDAAVSK